MRRGAYAFPFSGACKKGHIKRFFNLASPRTTVLTYPLCVVRQPPQSHGAKTLSTVQLNETTKKGRSGTKSLLLTKDGPAFPTVVLQARENMDKHKECVLLTKVGSFYEMYFEQAEKYGPLLNLKVAQKFTAAGNVPMVCPEHMR